MTLIEIMIALLIGAFLLGGILQIFINTKQTYRMQEGLSRLQENGRFAMDFLARDIRMAGYWGCLSPISPNVDIAGTNDNTASGDSIDDGTDTITLKGAFVQIPTGACGGSVDTTATYYTHASSSITYKINNGTLQQDTNGENNELIEGIENMQILYGEDTDADGVPNYYVDAATIANMSQVISIRISLLARTIEDNLAAQPVPYSFNGTDVEPGDGTHPDDRRLRRVFTSTIALRNRLP
ncbi:PilW family protein [Methylicorpusculum oleiharenae]|nr:PilW family protein [Methylicorpusculum oleiharenae]